MITRQKLKAFWDTHPLAEGPLKAWFKDAEQAQWQSPVEITQYYPTASILKASRVVFNIHGNDYRLVVKIHYNTGVVFIRFVGTHAEYDKLNAETI